MEQLVGDTHRLKISREKAVKELDWALQCCRFVAMKVSKLKKNQTTDELDLDLDLLYMYGTHNY